MNKLPVKLIFGFLGLATLASMVGAISGTVAWYAYVTRVTVSYSGTSVNSTKQLQIGIKSDVEVEFPEGLVVNDVPFVGGHYYFMNPGASLPASAINAYLATKGYATTTLEPVSSYTYAIGDAIDLRNSPIANKPFEEREAADIAKYVEIPFAFRVLESDLTNPTFVKSKEIYITDAVAEADGENEHINEAIRMYIDRNNGQDFIFNPTAENAGQTKVAGVLDISGDNVFDFVNDMRSDYYGCECLYGDYDLSCGPKPERSDYGTDQAYQDALDAYEVAFEAAYKALLTSGSGHPTSANFIDINGSGVTDRRTTFTAKHYEGIDYFEDLSGITPHYAQYIGTNSVIAKPNNTTGELESDYPVCVTANTEENDMRIAEFNCKIYIEGWDFAVIDDELSHSFNLGLTFEIN